jgi:uncharacterized protein (DUF2062 family)
MPSINEIRLPRSDGLHRPVASLSLRRVSTDSAPFPSPPVRSIWQRRIRDPIVAQLTQGITSEKIALTLAVGSAFAVFPILGTSTVLCFLAALVLRLNQPITQLINQVCWPVHVPVIYLCVRFGEKLFGVAPAHFSMREMSHLLWNDPTRFLHDFGATALHAVAAWSVIAPFYVAIVYFLTLPIIRSVLRLRAEVAPAPDHREP